MKLANGIKFWHRFRDLPVGEPDLVDNFADKVVVVPNKAAAVAALGQNEVLNVTFYKRKSDFFLENGDR